MVAPRPFEALCSLISVVHWHPSLLDMIDNSLYSLK